MLFYLVHLFLYFDTVDAQSANSGVERQTIKSTYRKKSIKGLSDRRPRRVSDLFVPDPTPTDWPYDSTGSHTDQVRQLYP